MTQRLVRIIATAEEHCVTIYPNNGFGFWKTVADLGLHDLVSVIRAHLLGIAKQGIEGPRAIEMGPCYIHLRRSHEPEPLLCRTRLISVQPDRIDRTTAVMFAFDIATPSAPGLALGEITAICG